MRHVLEVGGGQVDFDPVAGRGRLSLPALDGRAYADAQLDDYAGRPRRRFPNRPPRRLRLRARASHAAPAGTLGFGFWNDPFSLRGGLPAAPSAVWFFHASPPSNMALVDGTPGWGWKAATLNLGRWPSLLIGPAALAGAALARLPGLGPPIMAAGRRLAQAREASLADVSLTEWRRYELEWREGEARFWVDGRERLRAPAPPAGPLGFVLWIDNQYAIADRAGRVGFGLCPAPEPQWLEVADLELTPA